MSDKPKPPRCTARTGRGTPCQGRPLEGTTRCHHHSFKVPGRPGKLTPELTDRLLDLIVEGNYLETAAQAVGIAPVTLHRWSRRGAEAEAKARELLEDDADPELLYNVSDPDDWPYLDFRHALKAAEAYAETELLRKVQGRHGDAPWQAYMTVLERRHPARWARRDKVEHGGDVTISAPKIVTPSPDRRTAIAELLRESGALNAPED